MKDSRNKTSSENFYGDIRLYVESVENHAQVDQLCQYLDTIDSLKITSYVWSEKKGLVISFSLEVPTPLGVKLGAMNLVNQVYNKKNDFTVFLNNNVFTEQAPPVLLFSRKRVSV